VLHLPGQNAEAVAAGLAAQLRHAEGLVSSLKGAMVVADRNRSECVAFSAQHTNE
jgi:hypothetical protein